MCSSDRPTMVRSLYRTYYNRKSNMNLEQERDDWRARALAAEGLLGFTLMVHGDTFISNEMLNKGFPKDSGVEIEEVDDGAWVKFHGE